MFISPAYAQDAAGLSAGLLQFLPLIFISGVFFDGDYAPDILRRIAELFPLKHLVDGLSGAMVTGEGLVANAGALGVIAAWAAVGVVLAVRGFSWEARS